MSSCDEGSYTKYQPNPNLTLPIAQKTLVAPDSYRGEQHKNTKNLIIKHLQPKPMGNTCAIGQSPNHPKNLVAARHAPDSYPGRDIREKLNRRPSAQNHTPLPLTAPELSPPNIRGPLPKKNMWQMGNPKKLKT